MNIVETIRSANFIYIIGNGGSASAANHFANDLVKICGLKAISLCANEATITSYANDEDYSVIFLRQLEIFLEKDDLLISISTSGESVNVVRALEYARAMGAKVYEFPKGPVFATEIEHMQLIHDILSKLL